jgi:hypothetical protein
MKKSDWASDGFDVACNRSHWLFMFLSIVLLHKCKVKLLELTSIIFNMMLVIYLLLIDQPRIQSEQTFKSFFDPSPTDYPESDSRH